MQKVTTPSNETVTQRLWIGGLNPPNLTSEMVQQRIKASFEEKLDFLTFDDTFHHQQDDKNNTHPKKYVTAWGEDAKTFFFLTAKTKRQYEDQSPSPSIMTPFELISKQYNNVKWKGCQIQVELAKLHFLQRLEIERKEAQEERERLESQQSSSSSSPPPAAAAAATATNHNLLKSSTKIRHLRIKKQHGEEAYTVDTKPIETKNWKELNFNIKKQRTKYKKHEEKLIEFRKDSKKMRQRKNNHDHEPRQDENGSLSLHSKVFLNRGIHLSFLDDNEIQANVPVNVTKRGVDRIVDSRSGDSSSSSSVSEGDTSDQIDDNEPGFMVSQTSAAHSPNYHNEYKWSDSDDESDDSEHSENNNIKNSHKHLTHSNHNALSEFESAVEHESDIDVFHVDSNIAVEGGDGDGNEAFESLEDDVLSNLNVLANIFPDVKMRRRNENTELDTKRIRIKNPATSLMQRYDPNANTAINFELENDENKDVGIGHDASHEDLNYSKHHSRRNDDEDATSDAKDDDESCDTKQSTESTIPDKHESTNLEPKSENIDKPQLVKYNDKEQIYEQKKLESVFQQKRTGGGTTEFTLSSLFNFDTAQNVDKDLPIEDAKESENKGFSFSFDLSKVETRDKNENKTETNKIHNVEPGSKSQTVNDVNDSGVVSENAIVGLHYRNKLFYDMIELKNFEESFFSLNEGVDEILLMMDDANKKDEDGLKWEEERKTLTLDWKRKQKYAVTKKYKKMKIR
jgi:hypothetical protein